LHGPYEAEELSQLMAGIDWVVMGSIWWENSPLVIQEAFKFGRPVICPDIGGMVEKVRHGKGGLNYRARDSASLADSIRKAIETPDLYEHLQNSLPEYSAVYRIAGDHVMLYAQL
jgi:glycosyltransferase involved in cell wall biosynthesis